MRIQEHQNKLETNVKAETQNFGIGDASVVIEILRNRLYEHKIRTLVQEYICNARDAMREIGKGNEFEITVPNKLNPVFKVRDFGPGISPDRMQNVFVMYGSSTKRNTNGQTGGFGIGAKSAWSYTDSFTIVSIVDGERRTYVAHTGVNNNGRLDLVSTDKTDEPDGTQIQVAVKPQDIQEFRTSVFRAIYFWEQKPTLKGELDTPTLVSGVRISPLVEVINDGYMPEYVRISRYNSEVLAVIDGVPYTINQKMVEKVPSLKKISRMLKDELVLHFGNGIVEVSASRESIADGPITVAALEKMGAEAVATIEKHISDAFASSKGTMEYLQKYSELSGAFNVDRYSIYGDYTISQGWIKNPLFKKVRMTTIHCMAKNGYSRVEKTTKHELSESKKDIEMTKFNYIYFLESPEKKMVTSRRINEYLKKNTHMLLIEPLLVIEYDTPITDKDGKVTPVVKSSTLDMVSYHKVIAELNAKPFSSITYVEPPKVKKPKVKREDEQFCLHAVYGVRHTYTTLATNTQKWFYVPLEHGSWTGGFHLGMLRDLESYLVKEEKGKVCGMSPGAIEMVKGNKHFIPLADWIEKFKPSAEAISFSKYMGSKNRDLMDTVIHLKGLEDPFLIEMIEEYKNFNKNSIGCLPKALTVGLKDCKEVLEFKQKDYKLEQLLKSEYPLVQVVDRHRAWERNELVYYINAKYKAKKGSK